MHFVPSRSRHFTTWLRFINYLVTISVGRPARQAVELPADVAGASLTGMPSREGLQFPLSRYRAGDVDRYGSSPSMIWSRITGTVRLIALSRKGAHPNKERVPSARPCPLRVCLDALTCLACRHFAQPISVGLGFASENWPDDDEFEDRLLLQPAFHRLACARWN